MARPREFEIETVLRHAMLVFWRKGFASTSMADLYSATGLKPGNLYATFKDKETLFRRCFEAYAEDMRASLPQDLSGVEAISSWMDSQVGKAVEDPERKGCLIVNTITERDLHAPATLALAQGRIQEIRDFFLRALREAVVAGDLDDSGDIEARADALTGAVVSVLTLGRAGADRRTIQNIGLMAARTLCRSHAVESCEALLLRA
jgi:TetR/AcrR family transcriptional regulator, transcriptional repressor for nem operon